MPEPHKVTLGALILAGCLFALSGCGAAKTPEAEVERACHAVYWLSIRALPGDPGWFTGVCPGGRVVRVYGWEW